MDNCIFCKIVAGELPSTKIYEDEQTLAFLDLHPVNYGHILVVPKEHYENFSATPNEWLADAMHVADKVSKATMAGLGAEGFNLSLNNGKAAGQVIFHTHFHIIPRYSDDRLKPWPSKEYDTDEQKKEVAEKIKKNL